MKTAIREELKNRRLSLSEIDRERKSHRVFEKLINIPEFADAENIMIYISNGAEVVTHFMVKQLLNTDKKIYTPKVHGDHLIACRLEHWEDLDFGSYGILEARDVIEIKHPSELDLVIAPGVGFSPEGDRLGMGKGFYDRFLKKATATKIGFAYQEQIFEEIPTEEHDHAMDIVITDENIYRP